MNGPAMQHVLASALIFNVRRLAHSVQADAGAVATLGQYAVADAVIGCDSLAYGTTPAACYACPPDCAYDLIHRSILLIHCERRRDPHRDPQVMGRPRADDLVALMFPAHPHVRSHRAVLGI